MYISHCFKYNYITLKYLFSVIIDLIEFLFGFSSFVLVGLSWKSLLVSMFKENYTRALLQNNNKYNK